MAADFWAKLSLLLYGLVAVVTVWWQIHRCQESWGAWVLYVVERLYVPNVFHWRANGRCPFPSHSAAIIIANHRSPVDPLMVWMNHHLGHEGQRPMRVIGFLMAREYYEQPGLIGWISRQMQSIPVDRDGRDVHGARLALRRLKEGRLLGVFPEGRLNRNGGLSEADTGVAWLALMSKAPVYPVYIHDSPQREGMVEPFCTFSRVRVSYGSAIDLSGYSGKRKSELLLREVTDLLMSRLAELSGHSG